MKKMYALLLLLLGLCTACGQAAQPGQTAEAFAQTLSDNGLEGTLSAASEHMQTLTGDAYQFLPTDADAASGFLLYVYADADAAAADAACVSPDGFAYNREEADGTGVGVSTDWVDVPHFFRRENMIVRYIGTDAVLLSTLETLCGPQFAGG